MNDSFNDIGKRLPYHESDDYIDALINRSVKHALDKAPALRVAHPGRKRVIWATVAAVALLVIGLKVMINHNESSPTTIQESPIEQFLNSISDEEAAQLQCFEIEEIPEY